MSLNRKLLFGASIPSCLLADRTTGSMICFWHDIVVCTYVCPSGTLCTVAIRDGVVVLEVAPSCWALTV